MAFYPSLRKSTIFDRFSGNDADLKFENVPEMEQFSRIKAQQHLEDLILAENMLFFAELTTVTTLEGNNRPLTRVEIARPRKEPRSIESRTHQTSTTSSVRTHMTRDPSLRTHGPVSTTKTMSVLSNHPRQKDHPSKESHTNVLHSDSDTAGPGRMSRGMRHIMNATTGGTENVLETMMTGGPQISMYNYLGGVDHPRGLEGGLSAPTQRDKDAYTGAAIVSGATSAIEHIPEAIGELLEGDVEGVIPTFANAPTDLGGEESTLVTTAPVAQEVVAAATPQLADNSQYTYTSMCERLYFVEEFEWNTTQAQFATVYNTTISALINKVNKIISIYRQFFYFRFKSIKVVFSLETMQLFAGVLRVVYVPGFAWKTAQTPNVDDILALYRTGKGVEIFASEMTHVEYTIPWLYNKEYMTSASSMPNDTGTLGELYVGVISPLVAPPDVVEAIKMQVSIQLQGVQLDVPIPMNTGTLYNKTFYGAEFPSEPQLVDPESQLEGIESHEQLSAIQWYPTTNRLNGTYSTVAMADANMTSPFPDEMDVSYLASIYGYKSAVQWTISQPIGTMLFNFPVRHTTTGGSGAYTNIITPVDFIQCFAQNWSGCYKLKAILAKNFLTKGKLIWVYVPQGTAPVVVASMTQYPHVIWDIANSNVMEVRTPNVGSQPIRWNSQKAYSFMQERAQPGNIQLFVYSPLVTPSASQIHLTFWVAGYEGDGDGSNAFRLWNPCYATRYSRTANNTDIPGIEEQLEGVDQESHWQSTAMITPIGEDMKMVFPEGNQPFTNLMQLLTRSQVFSKQAGTGDQIDPFHYMPGLFVNDAPTTNNLFMILNRIFAFWGGDMNIMFSSNTDIYQIRQVMRPGNQTSWRNGAGPGLIRIQGTGTQTTCRAVGLCPNKFFLTMSTIQPSQPVDASVSISDIIVDSYASNNLNLASTVYGYVSAAENFYYGGYMCMMPPGLFQAMIKLQDTNTIFPPPVREEVILSLPEAEQAIDRLMIGEKETEREEGLTALQGLDFEDESYNILVETTAMLKSIVWIDTTVGDYPDVRAKAQAAAVQAIRVIEDARVLRDAYKEEFFYEPEVKHTTDQLYLLCNSEIDRCNSLSRLLNQWEFANRNLALEVSMSISLLKKDLKQLKVVLKELIDATGSSVFRLNSLCDDMSHVCLQRDDGCDRIDHNLVKIHVSCYIFRLSFPQHHRLKCATQNLCKRAQVDGKLILFGIESVSEVLANKTPKQAHDYAYALLTGARNELENRLIAFNDFGRRLCNVVLQLADDLSHLVSTEGRFSSWEDETLSLAAHPMLQGDEGFFSSLKKLPESVNKAAFAITTGIPSASASLNTAATSVGETLAGAEDTLVNVLNRVLFREDLNYPLLTVMLIDLMESGYINSKEKWTSFGIKTAISLGFSYKYFTKSIDVVCAISDSANQSPSGVVLQGISDNLGVIASGLTIVALAIGFKISGATMIDDHKIKNVWEFFSTRGRELMNIKGGLKAALECASDLKNWITDCLYTYIFPDCEDTRPAAKERELLNQMKALTMRLSDLKTPANLAKIAYNHALKDEYRSILTAYNALTIDVVAAKSPEIGHKYNILTRHLHELSSYGIEMAEAADFRIDPFHISFCGDPGAGKSFLSYDVVHMIADSQGKPKENRLYARSEDMKFYDNYTGQFAIAIDDINQIDTPESLAAQIRRKSNIPDMLDMADLRRKGMYFTSQLMVSTTNVPYPQPKGVASIQAYQRRRDVLVECKSIRPKKCPHFSHLEFNILKSTKPGAARVNENPLTYEEMISYLIGRYSQFMIEQSVLVKGMNRDLEVERVFDFPIQTEACAVVQRLLAKRVVMRGESRREDFAVPCEELQGAGSSRQADLSSATMEELAQVRDYITNFGLMVENNVPLAYMDVFGVRYVRSASELFTEDFLSLMVEHTTTAPSVLDAFKQVLNARFPRTENIVADFWRELSLLYQFPFNWRRKLADFFQKFKLNQIDFDVSIFQNLVPQYTFEAFVNTHLVDTSVPWEMRFRKARSIKARILEGINVKLQGFSLAAFQLRASITEQVASGFTSVNTFLSMIGTKLNELWEFVSNHLHRLIPFGGLLITGAAIVLGMVGMYKWFGSKDPEESPSSWNIISTLREKFRKTELEGAVMMNEMHDHAESNKRIKHAHCCAFCFDIYVHEHFVPETIKAPLHTLICNGCLARERRRMANATAGGQEWYDAIVDEVELLEHSQTLYERSIENLIPTEVQLESLSKTRGAKRKLNTMRLESKEIVNGIRKQTLLVESPAITDEIHRLLGNSKIDQIVDSCRLEGSSDENAMSVKAKLKKNTGIFRFGTFSCNYLGLRGLKILLPAHFCKGMFKLENYIVSITREGFPQPFTINVKQNKIVWAAPFEYEGERIISDFCVIDLIDCPQIPSFADVTNHFFRATEAGHLANSEVLLLTRSTVDGDFDSKYSKEIKLIENKIVRQGLAYGCFRAIRYELPSQPGDCGSPCIVLNPLMPNKLVGIHQSGWIGHNMGYCQVIWYEAIMGMLGEVNWSNSPPLEEDPTILQSLEFKEEEHEVYPKGRCAILGVLPTHMRAHMPFKSDIRTSRIFDRPFQHTSEPAVLKKRDERSDNPLGPMEAGLQKFNQDTGNWDLRHRNMVKAHMSQQFIAACEDYKGPRRLLTAEEVINGVPGFVEPLNMRTSPGFPYIKDRPSGTIGKSWLFVNTGTELNPYYIMGSRLQKDFDEVMIAVKRDHCCIRNYYLDWMKDERRPLEKIACAKTRLFNVHNVVWIIIVGMYYGAANAAYMWARFKVGSTLGIDMHGPEVSVFIDYLKEIGDLFWDGDVEKWDGGFDAETTDICIHVIAEWYAFYDAENFVKIDLVVVGHSLFWRIHIAGIIIYVPVGGMPSGHKCTSFFNTKGHNARQYMVYLDIVDLLKLAEYYSLRKCDQLSRNGKNGDDTVGVIAREIAGWYNPESIRDSFARHGIVFVPPTKIGGAAFGSFRPIGEVQFLKCKFRLDENVGKYHMCMSMNTINELTNWIRKGQDPEQALVDNLDDAARFLFHHGREHFDNFVKSLRAEDKHLAARVAPYEEYYEQWLAQHNM